MVIDEKKFVEFMQKLPIWNFVSKELYLNYSREMKTESIQQCYYYMLNQSGEF